MFFLTISCSCLSQATTVCMYHGREHVPPVMSNTPPLILFRTSSRSLPPVMPVNMSNASSGSLFRTSFRSCSSRNLVCSVSSNPGNSDDPISPAASTRQFNYCSGFTTSLKYRYSYSPSCSVKTFT